MAASSLVQLVSPQPWVRGGRAQGKSHKGGSSSSKGRRLLPQTPQTPHIHFTCRATIHHAQDSLWPARLSCLPADGEAGIGHSRTIGPGPRRCQLLQQGGNSDLLFGNMLRSLRTDPEVKQELLDARLRKVAVDPKVCG